MSTYVQKSLKCFVSARAIKKREINHASLSPSFPSMNKTREMLRCSDSFKDRKKRFLCAEAISVCRHNSTQTGSRSQGVNSSKLAFPFQDNININPKSIAFKQEHLKKKLAELEQNPIPPDIDTYRNLLRECGTARALSEGKRVHAHIVQSGFLPDRFLCNLIIGMYGKCGSVKDALNVFNDMLDKTVVTWNTLISAYAQHGNVGEALQLFTQMQSEGIRPNRITFLCILHACSNTLTLTEGKLIHKRVIESGLESDTIVINALINMYDKCGCLQKAQETFDNLSRRDLVSWNSIIAANSHHGFCRVAIHLFHRMQQEGLKPNRITFVNMLGVCSSSSDLEVGKSLHNHVARYGLEQDIVVGSALVNMYGKFGSVADARETFDKMAVRNIVTWNAMIGVYAQHGHTEEAFELFQRMGKEGLQPDKVTVLNILGACSHPAVLAKGKQIHSLVVENELLADVTVANALVNMYGNCGSLEDARAIFDQIHRRNVISWTTMIGAYAQLGHGKEAFQLFHQMQAEGLSPNKVTLLNVLSACCSEANLSEGQLVHTRILQNGFHSDVLVATALVNMYGKCGILENAWMIFKEMPERDVALWNAMISVCAQYGHGKEALSLFQQMQHEGKNPDKVTFLCALEACSSLRALAEGKLMHASINKHGFGADLVVMNALITMYGDCGSLEDAQKVFDCMLVRDLISWNAIIGAYTNQGYKKKALFLFKQMHQSGIKPDKVTLLSILSLYSNLADLDEAKLLHVSVFHGEFLRDTMIGNALILMYGKCGSVQNARNVFDEMPIKDVVSWNSMFTVYIQHEGHCRDALQLYKQMEHGNVKPDKVTFVSILNACANLADLTEGIKIHDNVLKYGMELDTFSGNALVNMYAKCGELETARMMFDRLSERDVVSWNAIIAAYAQHGQGEEALQIFKLMQQEDMKPDKITFITILSACSHAGLVEEGHQSFLSMCKELSYPPSSEHYGSMIDLFGRAGWLDEAEELLNKMPFEPSVVVWMTLLSACKNHGDLDRGRRAAEHAARLDPMNDAPYIMLSNMYAAAGRWCDVEKIRDMMAKQGAKRVAGCSPIEVNS